MYLSHFGLNEPPFRITPHTEFFFSGANRGATLEALLYAITHDEGIVKVTGEVGSGKTMLCRVLVERLPKSVETIYLANPSLSRDEILHVIAADLQVESRGERVTILLRALQERLIKLYAAGRRVVVLIDEAHAMPIETLEEIRLLSNLESNRHKLLQIVLFGQPELDQHLALPNMRQLKERITHGFKLEPLVRSDVESYVDFRMRAAGYRGPSVFAPRRDEAHRPVLAGSDPAHQHPRRQVAARGLRRRHAPGHRQTRARGGPRLRVREPAARRSERLVARRRRSGRGAARRGGHAPLEPVRCGTERRRSRQPGKRVRGDRTDHFPGPPQEAPAAKASPAPEASPAVPSPAAVATVAAVPAIPVTPATPPAPEAPSVVQPPATPTGARPPASGKLAQERFAATQKWLKTAPNGTWTIQLMTAVDPQAIERFLEEATQTVNLEDVYLYGVKQNGRQFYGVTYGNYPTLEDTITAMGDLPTSFKSRGPFHRSIGVMRRQNQE